MKRNNILIEEKRYRVIENSGINPLTGVDLISVDIQPEYKQAISFNLNIFTDYLNKQYESLNSLTFLYNGYDTLGMITENEYINWLFDNGLDEEVINNSKFYDKGYAFFRYCIDESIDEDEIVDLVKYMNNNGINDSREIDEDMWTSFMNEFDYDNSSVRELLEFADDAVNIPDLMGYLTNFNSKIMLCGGGVNECLKEVEIALKALNKNYNVLSKFLY